MTAYFLLQERAYLYVSAIVVSAVLASSAVAQSDATPSVQAWASSESFRLRTIQPGARVTDLEPFTKLIGNARVICLAEPSHGIHEFLTFRNRFAQFLIERMGVTAIAAETGYTESLAVEDYIHGRGELSPLVVGSVFSWSQRWAYPENADFIRWLRDYNARATTRRKIHFYGLDLTGGRGGRFVDARAAVDSALGYVSRVDAADGKILTQRFAPLLPGFNTARHDSLAVADRDALTAAIADLIGLFERRRIPWTAASSAESYDRAYRNAIVARQLDENFRSAVAESNPQSQREVAMAQNMEWALDREGPHGRILLFAANWHISKGPMITDRFGTVLGENLHALFGHDYFAIGSAYGQSENGATGTSAGDYPAPDSNSVAAMLSKTGAKLSVLDLRNVSSSAAATWFQTLRPIEGGRPDKMRIADSFDAIVFINTIHPSNPMGQSAFSQPGNFH